MSHQEKQEIFDSYFKSIKRVNVDCFLASFGVHEMLRSNLINHIFAACDLVQTEQQKRIAENVELNADVDNDGNMFAEINKTSIINPENLIK